MADRFLRKYEIAAMLGTSPNMAASVLSEHGVWPVDFGVGRSRGLRWLESAAMDAMKRIHAEAQPKPKAERTTHKKANDIPQASLASMSVNEIFELTSGQSVH